MHGTDNRAKTRQRFLWLGPMAIVVAITSCGRDSESTTPTPPTTPSPTPTTTFTLDAAADHYFYSQSLARLTPGMSFDVAFRPLAINHAETEGFAHAISFWSFRTSTAPEATTEDGVALSFNWSSDSVWLITMRTPPDSKYVDTGRRADIPIGDQKRLRVSCGADGTLSFSLEGTTLVTLPDCVEPKYVFAQVVGTKVAFEYLPTGTAASGSTGNSRSTAQPCGACAALALR